MDILTSSLVASSHYLALGVGLGSVFARGRALRSLQDSLSSSDSQKQRLLSQLFLADNFWGLAAVLWIVSGLWRAFGGLEKGTQYYLAHPLFWLKMGLFAAVFLLEIYPMVTFIRWRMSSARGRAVAPSKKQLRSLWRINHAELLLTFAMPWVASLMARGWGLGR